MWGSSGQRTIALPHCSAPSPPWKPWQLLSVTQQNSSHTTALGSCLACLSRLGSSHSPKLSLRVMSLQPGCDHPACSLSGICGSSRCLQGVGEHSFLTNFSTLRGQCLLINFRCFNLRKILKWGDEFHCQQGRTGLWGGRRR